MPSRTRTIATRAGTLGRFSSGLPDTTIVNMNAMPGWAAVTLESAGPVEIRETHTGRLVLAGDRAHQVKKPVVTDFLDFSSIEDRESVCLCEVGLTRRLASATPHLEDIWIKNLTLTAGLVDTYCASTLVALIAVDRLDTAAMTPHRFTFDDFEVAYDVFSSPPETGASKVLLTVSK